MVTTTVTNLTFEEYLTYDDGTGFHYELVDGKEVRKGLESGHAVPPTFQAFNCA